MLLLVVLSSLPRRAQSLRGAMTGGRRLKKEHQKKEGRGGEEEGERRERG